MKIIHLIADANTGGGQVYVLNLLKQFQPKPYELVVICPEAGYYVEDYEKYANTVYRINWQQPHYPLFKTLRKILKKEQPAHIHNHLWKACFFGTLAGQTTVQGTIFNHLHGDLIIYNFESRIQFRFFQLLNFFIAYLKCHYICVSHFEKKLLARYGVSNQKLTVVYNGVDTSYFSPGSHTNDFSQPLQVLCVARLHPAKGIDVLVEAAQHLSDEICIRLIGDGPLQKKMSAALNDKGITNLELLGYQPDIRPYLAQCHLFVLPSRWESFGIAIVEAMAYGKAVIATDTGGIPEVLDDGKGGYLCAVDSAQCLVSKIRSLQKNASLLTDFGHYNRRLAKEKFDIRLLSASILRLYQRNNHFQPPL